MHRSLLLLALAAAPVLADLDGSYVLPVEHDAIRYSKAPVDDRFTRLQKRIASGEVKLEFDERHGYLRSMLAALQVPIESQVLVFSKTSFQAPRISPRTPRALYFNDEVSVGWVPGGEVLELAAEDPRQGVIFYTLDQEKTARPRIDRRGECLQCHASGGTLGVPGLVVRSVFPERSGMPLFHAGGFVTDHRSPLKERWGGWYVTGTHGDQTHMGNVFSEDRDHPERIDRAKGVNLTSLAGRFDTAAYLSPHSDIVALLVLEHQTRMTNLLTRVGFETRMALHDQKAINRALGEPEDALGESATRRINNAAEVLVKYMLFADEAPLAAPVRGTSAFAKEFAGCGPRDGRGRSLREFDLERRIFRYPCSYMIYSAAFDELPGAARDRVYRRAWEVLTGADQTPVFARLSKEDRAAVLEVLRATKKGLPEYWRK
jgi:hypothetical protein